MKTNRNELLALRSILRIALENATAQGREAAIAAVSADLAKVEAKLAR
jgi:hypothetical protein